MVTQIATTTFLKDIIIYIRDNLLNNITDPISGSRGTNEKFVMTSYPERPVKYPIITVQNTNLQMPSRLGMQSELHQITVPVEIRVWARNVSERDSLTQSIINQLRNIQIGTGGTISASIYGFEITSAVNVDEEKTSGQAAIRSKVITAEYKFIIGA